MRPGFQTMIRDVELGQFDVVVSEALDRIGRNLADVAGLHDRLEFKRVALHTVATGEITTMHVGLLGTMAQLFLSDLRAKTKRGLAGRVRAGRNATGKAYGYDIVAGAERGVRRIAEPEAENIRRILKLYADGMSPLAIAKLLNAKKIPGPGGRLWSDGTIRGQMGRGNGILNNELYVGRLIWNRTSLRKDPRTGHWTHVINPAAAWETNEVPDLRIVDDALWGRVKARQNALSFQAPGKPTNAALNGAHRQKFLLSGLLLCGICGRSYQVVDKAHYGCATRRHKGTCTNKKFIARADIERRVLDGLKAKLLTPELFKVFAAGYVSEFNKLSAARSNATAGLERQLAEIERKIATIVGAIEGGRPPKALTERLAALEARQSELEAEVAIAKTAQSPVRLHPNLPELYARKVAELENLLDDDNHRLEAMNLIRSLIDKIVLTPKDKDLNAILHGDLARILAICDCRGAPTRRRPAG